MSFNSETETKPLKMIECGPGLVRGRVLCMLTSHDLMMTCNYGPDVFLLTLNKLCNELEEETSEFPLEERRFTSC